MKLFRTQLRLLLGASPAEPLSLDAIMSRAGYAKNDGRPFYRQYAAALVALWRPTRRTVWAAIGALAVLAVVFFGLSVWPKPFPDSVPWTIYASAYQSARQATRAGFLAASPGRSSWQATQRPPAKRR